MVTIPDSSKNAGEEQIKQNSFQIQNGISI